MVSQLNILIVDDEELFLEALSSYCQKFYPDANLTIKSCAKTALECVSEIDFNIIITDLNMPGMDGISFIKELKERDITAPIIIISGYGDKESITQALRSKAFDFLDKPFSEEHFRDVLVKAKNEDEKIRQAKMVSLESIEFLKEIRQDFIVETSEMLDECEEVFLMLENSSHPRDEIDKIFRLAHSIKGSANAIGIKDLGAFAHEVESLLMTLRRAPRLVSKGIVNLLLVCNDAFKAKIQLLKENSNAKWDIGEFKKELQASVKILEHKLESGDIPIESPETIESTGNKKNTQDLIRVPKERIDSISDLVGELIVLKSQLIGNEVITNSVDVRLNNIVRLFDGTLRELQDRSMELGLENMKGLFLKIQRVARDTADQLSKPINFKTFGDEIEVDRMIIEALQDPLLHLVRNSIDHGVEPVDKRMSLNKEEKASVSISARQAFGKVIIEIKDDGVGIDPDMIFNKALEKGFVSADQRDLLSEIEKLYLIFKPGFSTTQNVTNLSGRGVGLDVVMTNVQKVKGRIELTSKVNEGSCFRLILPMSQAITEGMIIRVDEKPMVMPLLSIKEVVCLNVIRPYEVKKGFSAIDLRGESLPLYSLSKLMRKKNDIVDENRESQGLVMETHKGLIVLSCHDVLEQTQLVVKSLGDFFEDSKGIAGGAILGNGSVALVIDMEGLLEVISNYNICSKKMSSSNLRERLVS